MAEKPSGFDDFELRLGDLLRGERATLGKSLLDVQRELKIKAAYIAAIENADPTAFETPGFIAGYVRSYARYLNMDPEWAFNTFCRESGFETAHGMSAAASTVKPSREERKQPKGGDDMFSSPRTPFIPTGDAFLARVEPGAIGSVIVLLALVGGLGYGGWTVLNEVQKVQFAPVEQAPTVMADVDPLAGGGAVASEPETSAAESATMTAGLRPPSTGAYDRLYRPEALDVPVMVARDAPISTLNPQSMGALTAEANIGNVGMPATAMASRAAGDGDIAVDENAVDIALASALGRGARPTDAANGAGDEAELTVPTSGVQVTEEPIPAVQLVAAREAWVRVTAPDGTVIYEATMRHGDTFAVPQTEEPATLRIGESGAVYFAVNGEHYGPVGQRGAVTSNVALSASALTDRYQVADISADADLDDIVRVAENRVPVEIPPETE
ncbi:helix-turn-helix domain-containing protein [Pelagovum pacificum]|nr:helix-turn-helix domain-containing protein [Pelagovum pacificum]